ncbi:DUF624 domain-containing protein [Evansella sp. AB-rgal1]|uniref:DUF624 domain-containing protein n=1 Tax=Evansella sp. AB-rgal1 TaxID=3242696 RepID=UPI00359E464D
MDNKGLIGNLYRVSEWLIRLAYINILWMLFTIVGLIILGIAPATATVFTIIRKWFMETRIFPSSNIYIRI